MTTFLDSEFEIDKCSLIKLPVSLVEGDEDSSGLSPGELLTIDDMFDVSDFT